MNKKYILLVNTYGTDWKPVSNPNWESDIQEGLAYKILETNPYNKYVEYKNLETLYRVIRSEDFWMYG